MSDSFTPGGKWVAGATAHVPTVWGDDEEVAWSKGEPLYIAGAPGVGKTTLAQQLITASCGVASLDVLGLTVTPEADRKVAYIAADRPRQAQRSLRRMVPPHEWDTLSDRLLVWEGPLPFPVLEKPAKLAEWLTSHQVGRVFIDSIKDIAGDTSDGKVGAAFNLAMQHLVSNGIDVCGLHHPRKSTDVNRKPRKLDDLHGSTWIAAGAGSVVYLYGEAGDPVVELIHLKQPAGIVGPMKIVHDHHAGRTTIAEQTTAWEILQAANGNGVTVKETATRLFATPEPNRNQIEKARRKLEEIRRRGQAAKGKSDDPKGPTRYHRVIPRDSPRDVSRTDHAAPRTPANADHAPITNPHAADHEPPNPFKGGRDQNRDTPRTDDELQALIEGI